MIIRRRGGTTPARTGLLKVSGLKAAARTEVGPFREHNEDAFVCRPEDGVFAVIDGMGGQQAGEQAAAAARDAFEAERDPVRAVLRANARICELSARPELHGLGCVVSGVKVLPHRLRLAHVGDTRVYLVSAAGCEQLTRDHTVAAQHQEELGLTDAEARGLGGHNKVTRDVSGRGHADDTWIDQADVPLQAGDLLFLCSDGVHGAVPSEELLTHLRRARREQRSPELVVDELIDLALARGSRDNLTALAVQRTAEPLRAPRTVPAPRSAPRWVVWALAAAVGLGAAALLGFLASVAAERRFGPREAAPVGTSLAQALAEHESAVDGELRLDGLLMHDGTLTALGPTVWPPGSWTTQVGAGRRVELRGLQASSRERGHWRLHLQRGSRLTLRQASLRLPEVELEVTLDDRSRFEIVDSHLRLAALQVTGQPSARVHVRGRRPRLGGTAPVVVGAVLEWSTP